MRNTPRFFNFFIHLAVCFLFSKSLIAQNTAGADKIVCTGGSVQIGLPQPACNGCCWNWEPSNGLSNATVSNPTVSGLTTTTEYTLVQSNPDGSAVTDKVTVYVYQLDMDAYKPKFIDGTEPKVPETQEEYPGVQTFVNLDSDDNDSDFDQNDTEIAGGDDEFIKLSILLELLGADGFPPPTAIPAVKIKNAGTDIASIRLWKSNDKSAGEYFVDEFFELSSAGGNTYSGFLWVEGISGHTSQQATKLFADFNPGSGTGSCASANVSITVIGVESFTWISKENGYTGDGKNDATDTPLDTYPSENGYPDHIRVFPEAKFQNGKPSLDSKDKVGLKIGLTVAPVEIIPIYIRLLDADDPSGAYTTLDLNDDPASGPSGEYGGNAGLGWDENNDNRGRVGTYKFGKLIDLPPMNLTPDIYMYFTAAKDFTLTMQVAQYPGDNYAVAVYGDLDFIKKLRNKDKYDKKNIVFESTTCSLDDCPVIGSVLVSDVLTVWRTLHIEYDRMSNPTWDNNLLIKGYFSDYEPGSGSSSIKQTKKLAKIRAPKPPDGYTGWKEMEPLKDGSVAPGRFTDGGVRIGDPITATVCDKGGCISSNGVDELVFTSLKDLTAGNALIATLTSTAASNSSPLVITDIERMPGPDFLVTIVPPDDLTISDYQNGKVSISGGAACSACVQTIPGNNSQFTIKNIAGGSNLKIPVTITDDDDIPWDGTSTLIQPLSFSVTKTAFAEVYIDAVNDGGGDLANNQSNIPFSRNLNDEKGGKQDIYSQLPMTSYLIHSKSKNYETAIYWVVYVISSWQYTTSRDVDPDAEVTSLGITGAFTKDCDLAQGGHVTAMLHEGIRDAGDMLSLEETCAHEIGHQFGLTHGDKDTGYGAPCVINNYFNNAMGLMRKSPPFNLSTLFITYHKNLLRSRYKSPGLGAK